MDVFTTAIGVGSAAAGVFVTGIVFWGPLHLAQRQARDWREHFYRTVREEGDLRSERDRLKYELRDAELRVDALIREVDVLRPLADLGKRRKAAMDRGAQAKRRARVGDEGGIARELLDEKGEVTTADVSARLGCDTKRANFIMRSIGAERVTRHDGERIGTFWSRPAAENQADAA